MKYIVIAFCGVLAFIADVQAQANPEAKLQACAIDGFEVSWDFTANPQVNYRLQQWVKEDNDWVSSSDWSVDPKGSVLTNLVEGSFYRVQGCADLLGKECVNSTLIWAPLLACLDNLDDAKNLLPQEPISFTDNKGDERTFEISRGIPGLTKPLRTDLQITQYNVYMAVKTMHEYGDVRMLEPMMKPIWYGNENMTHADWINFNVFLAVEGARTGSRPDLTNTGFEPYVSPY